VVVGVVAATANAAQSAVLAATVARGPIEDRQASIDRRPASVPSDWALKFSPLAVWGSVFRARPCGAIGDRAPRTKTELALGLRSLEGPLEPTLGYGRAGLRVEGRVMTGHRADGSGRIGAIEGDEGGDCSPLRGGLLPGGGGLLPGQGPRWRVWGLWRGAVAAFRGGIVQPGNDEAAAAGQGGNLLPKGRESSPVRPMRRLRCPGCGAFASLPSSAVQRLADRAQSGTVRGLADGARPCCRA